MTKAEKVVWDDDVSEELAQEIENLDADGRDAE